MATRKKPKAKKNVKAKKNITTVYADGRRFEVKRSADFSKTLKRIASECGFRLYRVFAKGKEIKPADRVPATFAGIATVKLKKYDEAGA